SDLVADSRGNLFGSTANGGAFNYGTLFEVPSGSNTITTLATFNGPTGQNPNPGLFLDSSGNLFGSTATGGIRNYNSGTVFELPTAPAITTLALDGWTVNQPSYSQAIGAVWGTGTLTFRQTGGTLPPGLTLSSSGVVSGTPTGSGSYSFTVTVTDALGATD